MKPADATAALRRELAAAERNVGKYIARPGRDYASFGYALDGAIADKREFAVAWRKWVLEEAAGRPIESRTLTVRNIYVENGERSERTYRVFSSRGRDFAAVYAIGGSNCPGRLVSTPTGDVMDELRREGWRD
jgi:hypothetical protein